MLILIITISAVAFSVFANTDEEKICRQFLHGFGWELSEDCETSEVHFPEVMDKVNESYNVIQNEVMLDITPYLGKSGTRYTFVVTNYPLDVGETVYANVVCIDGLPIAGDIMTVSMNGFMHSLKQP